MSYQTEAAKVAELAIQGAEIKEIHGHPVAILSAGQDVRALVDLMPAPTRKKGRLSVQDEPSFILFYNKHKTTHTGLYADRKNAIFQAIFNDHGAENCNAESEAVNNLAGWRDHLCRYTCPQSNEWLAWTSSDNRKMSQTEFAYFIEQNLVDIVEPNHADMVEISRTLTAKKAATFSSSTQLSNGSNQFTYEEEIRGTTASGKIDIPEKFKIGIPVFLNGTAYKIEANLRYRIKDGHLEMWYELVRSHDVYEDAFNSIFESIKEKTGQDIICADL